MRIVVLNVVVAALAVSGSQAFEPVVEVEAVSHCVVFVFGEEPTGEFVVTDPECFPDFGDAMAVASGGTLAPHQIKSGEELFVNDDLSQLLLFSLGIHFDGSSGSGSSVTVSGGSCTGGYWNTGAAWANRISSSWNGCYRLRHHDGPNKTGAAADTVGSSSTHNLPGTMNNKTESVSYWGS